MTDVLPGAVTAPAVAHPARIRTRERSVGSAVVMTLYLLATTVSPLVSAHRIVKFFGALALLSFGAAYYFYTTWFISVWCFFAAVLSSTVALHFAMRRAKPGGPP